METNLNGEQTKTNMGERYNVHSKVRSKSDK